MWSRLTYIPLVIPRLLLDYSGLTPLLHCFDSLELLNPLKSISKLEMVQKPIEVKIMDFKHRLNTYRTHLKNLLSERVPNTRRSAEMSW